MASVSRRGLIDFDGMEDRGRFPAASKSTFLNVVKPDGVLTKELGQKNVLKIAKLLGSGDRLAPCGEVVGAAGRKARIAELYLEGMSRSQIAAHLGVHIKTVSRATARLRDEEQPFLKL